MDKVFSLNTTATQQKKMPETNIAQFKIQGVSFIVISSILYLWYIKAM